jgi:hypothetical protein
MAHQATYNDAFSNFERIYETAITEEKVSA